MFKPGMLACGDNVVDVFIFAACGSGEREIDIR